MRLVESPPTSGHTPAPEATAPSLLHSAFYRFVHLPDPEAAARELRGLGCALGLGGSVVVAAEGPAAAGLLHLPEVGSKPVACV